MQQYLAARHRLRDRRLLEALAVGMEEGRELGEETEGCDGARIVQHVAAAARRPDEGEEVARESLVERALQRDLARVRARDGKQLVPRRRGVVEP